MKFLSNRRKRFPLFFAILGIAGAAILFLSGVLAMNAGPPLSSAFLLLISLCLITGATPGVASLMVFRGIPVAVKYDDLEVSFTFPSRTVSVRWDAIAQIHQAGLRRRDSSFLRLRGMDAEITAELQKQLAVARDRGAASSNSRSP